MLRNLATTCKRNEKIICKNIYGRKQKDRRRNIINKERRVTNEDINILSKKYNFKMKIYFTKAESYVKEINNGNKVHSIYMLLERCKISK